MLKWWRSTQPEQGRAPSQDRAPTGGQALAIPAPVVIVAATRMDEATFWQSSNLGTSLGKARLDGSLSWDIAFANQAGLPLVYNRALATLPDEALVVFVHDDVFIYDYFLAARVREGLANFDVIGVVGHPAPHPLHVGWSAWRPADASTGMVVDQSPKSGAIEHSPDGRMELTYFGPSPQPVKLLDGVFLAARVGTLRSSGAAFDPRFDFHFYDLDFCRTCLAAGVRLGTWPIALSHASLGSFGTPVWEAGLAEYREKWRGSAL